MLVSHPSTRHLPKRVVDLGEQLVERRVVAARVRLEELGEVVTV